MTADELKAWAKKAILNEAAAIEMNVLYGRESKTFDQIEGSIAKHKVLKKLAAHVDGMSVVVVDREVA